MATIHGKNGKLYFGTVWAESTEFSFDVDFDTVDDSAQGDAWETKLKGSLRWSGSFAGNYDDADELPFDAATTSSLTNLYAYPDRGTMTNYYYGTAWVKLSAAFSRTDAARLSGTFEGSGALAKKP